VVARGVVAVTPTDSFLVCGLDARTGELRWEQPRDAAIRCLYGARDATLVLGGERLELRDIRTGERLAPPVADLDGTGRGVVAEDGIYVPCRDKLRRVGWDGAWDEQKSRSWPGGADNGGNLLVVDGAVILATQDGLQVYYDRRDAEQILRGDPAGAAGDPAALYRGAIRLLQAGSVAEAAELLARVVERTARAVRSDEDRLHRAARKRLFGVLLEAGRGDLAAGRPDGAAARFRSARDAAPDAAGRVEAALLLGQAYGAQGEPARAVEELQRLLADHGEDVVGGAPVFETARAGIDAVIRRAGRSAYAAPEASAGKLLEAARREGTPDAFDAVFRLYPNSLAAEEALLEAAGAQSRLGRPDQEVAALRRFLREYAGSGRAPEAHAALVRALEKKGHWASAAALLRRMARVFPDAPVADGERRVSAREFAEARLKGEAYARAGAVAEAPRLAPPLRKAFEHSDREYREGIPLRVLGAPPASAADLLLMNYGLGVKAFDLARRAEAWHVKTGGAVRLAAFAEESLLLADEEVVTRLNARTGAREWAFTNPARMRGFALAGSFVVFLAAHPRHDSVSLVTAVDIAQGTVAWSQTFEGIPASGVQAAGDFVAFTTVSPHRIHLFETETGKRLLSNAPFTASATAQVIHAAPDLLVLHAERRFLEAYDLPAGTLRWRVNLERMTTRAVEIGPAGLVLLGVQRTAAGDEQDVLAVVHVRNGKIVRMKEGAGLADPRFLLLDAERAVVVSREADRTVGVRSVRLSDLEVEWTANVGGAEATLLPPALARDHVVVATFEEGKDRKYAYGASLLDKRGAVGQNIKSEAVFERPPNYGLANGALIFSVDTKVDVHR
jgi:tetratricopeptide (TPR) repeat protein